MTTESELHPKTTYSKIVNYEESSEIVRNAQQNGMKVVLTTGVYDLFHYKHAESLACISLLGNFTIIGIPGDLQVSKAGTLGTQNKDDRGPIIDFEKRSKMVSHLPYVDLIFKKTTNKLDLVKKIQPDILAQSITSGYQVINEVLELAKYLAPTTINENLAFYLPTGFCEVVFIDDIVSGYTSVVKPEHVLEKAKIWEENRFSDNKFHGSSIKQEIIRRFTENK